MRFKLLWIGACLLLVIVSILVWQLRPEAPELGASETVPVLAAVTTQERSFVRNARLATESSKPVILLSAGAEGRITEVSVAPGAVVESGMTLAEVNGVDVLAVHSRHPFWRVLDTTSRGDNVAQLRCFLRSQGLLEGSCEDYFDSETERAVGAFNRRIGREDVTEFDPGYIIWLPSQKSVWELY